MKQIASSLAVAAFLLFSASAGATSSTDDGFLAYWAKFRAAALRGDLAGSAALTRFPLEAGLEADQDRAVHITRAQFPSLFRTELGCPANDFGSTLDMIKHRTNGFGKYDYHIKQNPKDSPHLAGRAIIDRFSFEKSGGQWKLTGIAYGDITEFHDRLRGRC